MMDLLGTTFKCSGFDWIVTSIDPFDESFKKSIEAMEKTGKHPARFFARKVLKSGKESKQGGMFYCFKDGNKFIKVL